MHLSRRRLLQQTAMLAAFSTVDPLAAAVGKGMPTWYDKAIVINGLGSFSDPYGAEEDILVSSRARSELLATGVTSVNMTVGGVGNDPDVFSQTEESIGQLNKVILDNPDFLIHVKSTADIRHAKANGQIALIYGTQDTSMVGNQLDRIEAFRQQGVRIMQLTYNLRNLCGDGALEPANAGLSRLGHAMIEGIEAANVLLDLSHGGQRTIAQAIAVAKRPMSISHTGCRSLHDNPRNVYDAELRALADKGGVAGIYFMPFLTADSKPSGEDLVRHIEHAANVCGEDHVSLGTDGDLLPMEISEETWKRAREMHEMRSSRGINAPGEGPDILTIVHDYNSLDRFQRLSQALAARGWTTTRLEKLFGGNLMRLYDETWSNE